jgi:hypothetical protein
MSGRAFHHVVGGLAPSTAYHWRITCGPQGGTARTVGVAATLAGGGGAVSIPMSLAPPPGRGVADAVVDYGPTAALGSSLTVPCASSCTANLAGAANRPLFYRVTFRDSGGATVASGAVVSTMGS